MPTQTRYAGFWIRLVADVIDTLLLTVAAWFLELMFLGIVYFVGASAGVSQYHKPFNDAFNPFFLQVFNGVLYLLLAIPYFVWGHYRYGTTLGKRPFRIYVVSHDNLLPITLVQSWLRCVGYLVSYLPFGVGYIMVAFQPEKRALHDLMAKTVSIMKTKPHGNPAPKRPELHDVNEPI
jgi:uncharacterized RDD family membrane protein YckC